VEPTSKIDAIRVLERIGVAAPSASTIYRMLERVSCFTGKWTVSAEVFPRFRREGCGLL
jgi:hypothetical protein